ncbi:hypothetical protein BD410DRAFT_207720 [Rickenella mellea]|uniref:PPM-type phosphatase domain-containing protein n=1 Tax=Rickenella mellea TaxID=50990 RepID=A0A4Y7Q4H9_9AGAM|nr:hypothetical protein BD410DRAFT_207720 [Rickenella mellea]
MTRRAQAWQAIVPTGIQTSFEGSWSKGGHVIRARKYFPRTEVYKCIMDYGGILGQGYFGVFDGKRYVEDAEQLAQMMHEVLLEQMTKQPEDDPVKAIKETFRIAETWHRTTSTYCGPCAAIAFLRLEDKEGKQWKDSEETQRSFHRVLYTANIGDCRASLFWNDGDVVIDDLSPDETKPPHVLHGSYRGTTYTIKPGAPEVLRTVLDGQNNTMVMASDGLWTTCGAQLVQGVLGAEVLAPPSQGSSSDRLIGATRKDGLGRETAIIVVKFLSDRNIYTPPETYIGVPVTNLLKDRAARANAEAREHQILDRPTDRESRRSDRSSTSSDDTGMTSPTLQLTAAGSSQTSVRTVTPDKETGGVRVKFRKKMADLQSSLQKGLLRFRATVEWNNEVRSRGVEGPGDAKSEDVPKPRFFKRLSTTWKAKVRSPHPEWPDAGGKRMESQIMTEQSDLTSSINISAPSEVNVVQSNLVNQQSMPIEQVNIEIPGIQPLDSFQEIATPSSSSEVQWAPRTPLLKRIPSFDLCADKSTLPEPQELPPTEIASLDFVRDDVATPPSPSEAQKILPAPTLKRIVSFDLFPSPDPPKVRRIASFDLFPEQDTLPKPRELSLAENLSHCQLFNAEQNDAELGDDQSVTGYPITPAAGTDEQERVDACSREPDSDSTSIASSPPPAVEELRRREMQNSRRTPIRRFANLVTRIPAEATKPSDTKKRVHFDAEKMMARRNSLQIFRQGRAKSARKDVDVQLSWDSESADMESRSSQNTK